MDALRSLEIPFVGFFGDHSEESCASDFSSALRGHGIGGYDAIYDTYLGLDSPVISWQSQPPSRSSPYRHHGSDLTGRWNCLTPSDDTGSESFGIDIPSTYHTLAYNTEAEITRYLPVGAVDTTSGPLIQGATPPFDELNWGESNAAPLELSGQLGQNDGTTGFTQTPQPEHTTTTTATTPSLTDAGTARLSGSPGRQVSPLHFMKSSLTSYSPSSSGSLICPLCSRTLADRRSLQRHMMEKHGNPKACYRCRCGKGQPRKANHTRHIKRCGKPGSAYVCICGALNVDIGLHKTHIHDCGRKQVGRPPGSRRKV